MTGKRPFEVVVAEHGATVLRVCRAVLGPADAEDAWSETFLAALKAYPQLPADANVEAWLGTIPHRKAIDGTRAALRRPGPGAGGPEPPARARAAGGGLGPAGAGARRPGRPRAAGGASAPADDMVLQPRAAKLSPRILNAPARLDAAARQVEEYFAGRRGAFDLPLDFRLSRGFRRIVLGHLPGIGYGHTASYAVVAAAAGRPRAVRAVGTACATNPLPVGVSCHRGIRADGRLGGYPRGAPAQQGPLTPELVR